MISNSHLVWRKLYRPCIKKALSLYPSPATYDLSNLRHLIKYLLVYQFAMFCYEHSCSCIMFWLTTVSEKAMAAHSSTLAWKIPWMEEPGGLQSMGSLRVGHD